MGRAIAEWVVVVVIVKLLLVMVVVVVAMVVVLVVVGGGGGGGLDGGGDSGGGGLGGGGGGGGLDGGGYGGTRGFAHGVACRGGASCPWDCPDALARPDAPCGGAGPWRARARPGTAHRNWALVHRNGAFVHRHRSPAEMVVGGRLSFPKSCKKNGGVAAAESSTCLWSYGNRSVRTYCEKTKSCVGHSCKDAQTGRRWHWGRPLGVVCGPQEHPELPNIIRLFPKFKRQHFPWRRPACAIFQHMASKLNRTNKEIGFANRSNQRHGLRSPQAKKAASHFTASRCFALGVETPPSGLPLTQASAEMTPSSLLQGQPWRWGSSIVVQLHITWREITRQSRSCIRRGPPSDAVRSARGAVHDARTPGTDTQLWPGPRGAPDARSAAG